MAIQKFKSMIKRSEGAILSDGTLDVETLLAKSYDLLKNQGINEELQNEILGLFKCTNREFGDLNNERFYNDAVILENQQGLADIIWNEDVYNYFNEISPKGYYFGSSNGDGALIGWFKFEEEGEEMEKNICPRCKKNELHEDEAMNSLSRKDNETYICDECGTEESMEEMGF